MAVAEAETDGTSAPGPPQQLDLVIVGAGPHALSLLCRLIDTEPDLLSEEQRTLIMAKAGTRARAPAAVRAHLKKRFDSSELLRRVAVVDAHGTWMGQWTHDFAALRIPHCRSHSDLHPCPFDFQSLRVWAEMQKRENEMWPMHYIERAEARAQGYTGPYTLPGTKLFLDFCRAQVERYNLGGAVRRDVVREVRLLEAPSVGAPCSFEVRLEGGEALRASRVVVATGPGLKLQGLRCNLPWWCDEALTAAAAAASERDKAAGASPCLAERRLCHSSQLLPSLGAPTGEAADATGAAHDGAHELAEGGTGALAGKRVLVVGGGQSAGHLALFALGSGSAHVAVATRRPIQLKPFDVDLPLIGEERGKQLAAFWREPDAQAKLRFIRGVRGGGSMAHEVFHGMIGLGAAGSRLTLKQECEVSSARWRDAADAGDDDGGGGGGHFEVNFDDGSGGAYDLIWLATGGDLDVSHHPLLAYIHEQRPISLANGLPELQPDLAWAADVPLYVLGGFAQLQLGPDALNLAGCRAGSVRVATVLRPALGLPDAPTDSGKPSGATKRGAKGRGVK